MQNENVNLQDDFYYCEVGKENEMKPINNKGFQGFAPIEIINEEEMSETILGLENLWSSINKTTKIRLSKLASVKLKEMFCMPIDYKKIINRRKRFGKRRNMRWK